jgi:hypothetical protein
MRAEEASRDEVWTAEGTRMEGIVCIDAGSFFRTREPDSASRDVASRRRRRRRDKDALLKRKRSFLTR